MIGSNLWVQNRHEEIVKLQTRCRSSEKNMFQTKVLKFQVEIRVKFKRNIFSDIQAEFSYHIHFTHTHRHLAAGLHTLHRAGNWEADPQWSSKRRCA